VSRHLPGSPAHLPIKPSVFIRLVFITLCRYTSTIYRLAAPISIIDRDSSSKCQSSTITGFSFVCLLPLFLLRKTSYTQARRKLYSGARETVSRGPIWGGLWRENYRVGHKNVALYFWPYLCQLSADFQNSFIGTLCRQFAIMWLLYIPPHLKCVSTLPSEI